jgi:hypothetical protein
MTRMATDPRSPNPAGPTYGQWSNFTVFSRVDPIEGSRFEIIRDIEKIANQVEDDIKNMVVGSFGVQIEMPGPVMHTPQFGQKPTRLTFTGFMLSEKPVRPPLTDKQVDSDNRTIGGPSTIGGNIRDGVNATADQDDDVRLLKATLETISPWLAGRIYHIELNGVTYGVDGRSFPT